MVITPSRNKVVAWAGISTFAGIFLIFVFLHKYSSVFLIIALDESEHTSKLPENKKVLKSG